LEYLLAHAPGFNPVERILGHLKHHAILNHGARDLTAAPARQSQSALSAKRLRANHGILEAGGAVLNPL
jgi:hypothetical protein